LSEGSNEIVLALAEPGDGPVILMDPVVSDTITVIYEILVPELTITSPEEGSVIYSQDVEIEFTVDNFTIGESEGKVKYTVDEETPLYITGSNISLSGLSYGEHTVVLELVNNDESSLVPAVTSSVTFTCEERTAKIYELVTSMDALSDGGKYLFVGEKDASYYALGWQKTSNRHAVPVTISNNTITVMPAIEVAETQDNINPYEITLEETTNGFAFYDALNEKYLVPRAGSYNGMLLSATQEDWTVSVGTGSVVSAVANNSTTYPRGTMQFNPNAGNDPLFSCYASATQTGFYLYKAQETGEPYFRITSPSEGAIVGTNQVSVEFIVHNFIMDGDTPDGKVAYKLGTDGAVLYTTSSPVTISGLALGANTIYFELVDNSESPLPEPVTAELTIIYELLMPELTITSPEEGSVIYSQDVEIEFTVENFTIGESDGKVKYTVDEGTASYATGTSISLSGLSYGEHTVMLELVNNDESSLDPVVSTIVTFTCAEAIPTVYALVTSSNELVDGGRYLFVGIKNDAYYALGWQKTSNRHAVPVTVQNNTITVLPAIEVTETQDNINPYEITFEETTNGFAFYDALNEKYLVPRTSSNNGLVLTATEEDWTVTVGADYLVSAVANNSTTYPRGTMQFNPNSGNDPLFSCYASATQTGFYIYKAIETDEPYLGIISPADNTIFRVPDVDIEFQVYNFDLGTEGKVKYTVDDDVTEYTTTNPVMLTDLGNGSYTVVLELVDLYNASLTPPVTASVTFTVEQVGVDTDFTGIVKIYPNPAKENINIELAEDVDKISIVNVMGQIVMEMVPESKTQSIDLGNFERGVYFIKISKANFVNTYKIIVQ
ncbi:MAG: T9SS type A sorting domain-containing protein, partial [Bacteroidales bacterium]|nr:T9SS type A sorting domain-containing protein [Bacteroidales bacterium]